MAGASKKMVVVMLDPELKHRFKVALAREGVSAQMVLEEAIQAFLARCERKLNK